MTGFLTLYCIAMNLLLHGPKFNKLILVIKACSVQWTSTMSMPPGPKNVLLPHELHKAPQIKVEETLGWGKLTYTYFPTLGVWIFLDFLNKVVDQSLLLEHLRSNDGDTLVKGTTENSGSPPSYWARTEIYEDTKLLFIKHRSAHCIRNLWVGRQLVPKAERIVG